MALGTVVPWPVFHGFANDGTPLSGGKLYTYASGTVTDQATYSDAGLTIANANPVVLDSAGRANIFLAAATYKFVLKTSADVTLWTIDGVAAASPFSANLDVPGTAGEALSEGNVVYLSTGAGGTTAGRWYKADADAAATSSAANAIGMVPTAMASGATGSIRLQGRITGLSGLTPGAPYYVSTTAGALTAVAPTFARFVGPADSATSIVVSGALNGGIGVFTTLTVTGTATFQGAIVSDAVTDSTSTLTGAIQTDGGLGVVKALWVGGLANVAGAVTMQSTLAVTGVATLTAAPIVSALTASLPVFSNGSKALVSNAMTGTGDVVMSASPTMTGTITAAAITASGVITANGGVTGNVTGNVSGSSGSTTGNAATATALQTARAINGTNFDGTAAITVTAAAGTLTGTTLNSSVVTSSLTTVGALNTGSITSGFGAIDIGADAITAGAGNFSGLLTVSGYGTHVFGAPNTSTNIATIALSGGSGAGGGGYTIIRKNATDVGYFGGTSALIGGASNALAMYGPTADGTDIYATHASGAIRFYSGGTTEAGRMHASRGFSWGDTTDPGATNFRVAGLMKAVLQPGFLAFQSSNQTFGALPGTVDFDSEVYDEAGNFSADTFTAPVAGRYLFTVGIRINSAAGTTSLGFDLITSNRTYTVDTSNTSVRQDYSVIADMDASDTAYVQARGTLSTLVLTGDATALYTWFSGRLLP